MLNSFCRVTDTVSAIVDTVSVSQCHCHWHGVSFSFSVRAIPGGDGNSGALICRPRTAVEHLAGLVLMHWCTGTTWVPCGPLQARS
jgi:hypothetical protein